MAAQNNQQPQFSAPMPVENQAPPPIQNTPPAQNSAETNTSDTPQPPAPNLGGETVTTAGQKKGSIKKILTILLVILMVGGLVAVIVGVVLPRLSNSGIIPGQKAELTWWGLWEDDPVVESVISDYESEHPNVVVKYVKQSKENYRERLANAMAKGDAPDIFRLHNTWVPMFRNQLSVAPASVMSPQEFESTFYPVAADDFMTTEGVVGIPLEYDGLAMFVNEEIFSTYGATIPKSWSELRTTAKQLTIKDADDVIQQAGVAMGETENVDHWQEVVGLLLLQNGANLTKVNDDASDIAIRFYKQFSQTDGVWDTTQPNSTIAFATGRLAIYFGPSWRAFEIMDQNPNLKFKVVPVPQLPKEDPNAKDITYATYWGEGVWENSEFKDEAWKFLKYMSSKDVLAKLYDSAGKTRRFGEPYSRVDMRDMLLSDPVVGGFMQLAPSAKSWYLVSRTFDGETGINTSLSKYFEDTINSAKVERQLNLGTLSTGVQTVLSKYGLVAPLPTATQ